MKKPELLAPAGNMECLKAAIMAGCDAVYLSGKLFTARQYSNNFTTEELKEAVLYAHLYSVKVYITVNTVIYEAEVENFMMYIDYLVNIGVDALIIQDIGMMDLIRKTYPDLELHASTQMHIHNLEGVKLLEKLGIKRAVLARETKIDDIKKIKENTNIEIELFVHGALCVSYSGQCLMSSLIGGRSGNRGTCSQCCRMMYKLENDDKILNDKNYLLSMKDLNTLPYLEQLFKTNIDSLKIEGRMKRSEYVYLVTKIYRQAIDSYFDNRSLKIDKEDITNLEKIFNREFTKGFMFLEENDNITNEYRPNHMGKNIGKVIDYKNNIVAIELLDTLRLGDGIRIINDKEDIGFTVTTMFIDKNKVSKADKGDIITIKIDGNAKIGDIVVQTTDSLLLKEIDKKINENKRKVKITGKITCLKNEPLRFKIICDDILVEITRPYIVEEAISSPTTKNRIYNQINRLGDTPYAFENLIVEADDDIFVKIDELNSIRREAIKKISLDRCNIKIYEKHEYNVKLPTFNKEKNLNALISSKEDYKFLENYNIFEFITDNEKLYYDIKETILKLPRVINNYKDYHEKLLASELGSIYKYDLVDTDFSLNITNSYSVAFLHSMGVNKITLSYELNKNQIKNIITAYKDRYQKHPNLEVIIYSRPEAMVSKYNLLKKYNLDKGILKDKYNNKFPVKTKDNLMYIYMYKPIIHTDYKEYYDLGINNLRINIIDEEDYDYIRKLFNKII